MQVNSAQDYLTAQKRRIIATLSQTNPPPAHRRYNSTYISTVANTRSKYERTPYPQNLSLAPGSTPGLVYTTPGVRPTIDLCCVVAAATVAAVAVATVSFLTTITLSGTQNGFVSKSTATGVAV